MEPAKSKGLADSIGDTIAAGSATGTGWGSTNAMEVTSERSAS